MIAGSTTQTADGYNMPLFIIVAARNAFDLIDAMATFSTEGTGVEIRVIVPEFLL